MKDRLWEFSDNNGSFVSYNAHRIKSLYFPLCNDNIMSSITPDLHGDIKTGQNSFLLTPVSRIDLSDSRSSRNFWVYINKDKIWSATGVSKDLKQIKDDKFKLEAGLLWHKVTRENKVIGLKAEILSFVPASGEPVEIMQVKLINVSSRPIKFTPIAAIPIYARAANNIRDHRHVTSLLQRIKIDKFGVVVKPTLIFDETGHRPNALSYFVMGFDEKFKAPLYIYPTQEMFCGDAGDLEAPESVLENLLPNKQNIQGKEAMGALRFNTINLKPGVSHTYIILLGISAATRQIKKIIGKFNSPKKVADALIYTEKFWLAKTRHPGLNSGNPDFANWFRWVSIQPMLRRIFGCSFLPDFDYGKGGRGWRDLWQDCLSIILSDPKSARQVLINNFGGVRIDGTNATIIAKLPGEFIADRNNISRVWMDHGVWPLITLDLYLEKTGDVGILFEQAPYFQASARGTVLEHLLIQNLRQFYNLGEHRHVRLEGADWNDGLDMAKERGESVAFSCMYAANLATLSQLILKTKKKKIRLAKFLFSPRPKVGGRKVDINASAIAAKLQGMSQRMLRHIRQKEWLREGFFNGYYDNRGRQVEGRRNGVMRMCLASQVFAITSGVAQDWQIKKIIKNVNRYLRDPKFGGYHLNTDFKREEHDLGRAFSFSYGDKENGAIFNHMAIMYAYALLKRGYRKEGKEVLQSIYRMSVNTPVSKIYPCLPEYFNAEGRGMYSYLTGSASWFLLTMRTYK